MSLLELGFGDAGFLEIELVEELALEHLAHRPAAAPGRRGMKGTDSAPTARTLSGWMQGAAPGGGRAPVVADHHGRLVAQGRDEADDVVDHFHLVVGGR
jgi:hypothetical protein